MLACTALDTTAEAEQTGWPALPASPISQNMFNILPHLANSSMLDKVISSEFIPKYHLKSSSINQKPKRQYSENIFLKNATPDKDKVLQSYNENKIIDCLSLRLFPPSNVNVMSGLRCCEACDSCN